ncbi:DUF397 domain-containing protein [Streptomyces aidingensis]|uniref:DUF397 domain-containing protein n=1 Tax=Streptomyces aidingensis TaxID=910347 RepID=A0A1I1FQV3_9ACTN|nr:DUF397 domain-containing protein [Streptomyces aidingensis]SFC01651.1 protein of unknown function [Streptomyces aidingensis]
MREYGVAWQRSSRCQEASNCVELGHGPRGCGTEVLIRESAEPGTVLAASTVRLRALLVSIKGGTLPG